ncbi:MAG TPA: sigma-54 dependent transcriptional regulator [Anaeromyxobacteraceae bacterium]|nr:sigma-54 dependent transcriptional regulator [Anaeromyxobacteraceae bacterium]
MEPTALPVRPAPEPLRVSPSRRPAVLVVDDEVRSLEALRRTLEEDFTVFTAPGADDAEQVLRSEHVDIVLCDQRMPGTSGVDFLRRCRSEYPDVLRIIISGYTEAEDIIGGINDAGIWQYVLKPWRPEHLLHTLKSAAELARLQREHHRLDVELRQNHHVVRDRVSAQRHQARDAFSITQIVRSPTSPVDVVCALGARIAPHNISVLVTGEPGTGKELLARAIHYAGPRAERPFVVHHCGSTPDDLADSELFGHKRGSLAGAEHDRPGLFEQSYGGTLFLDDVDRLSPAMQVKLLGALQDREFKPVGATRALPIDVRVVSASAQDLEALVRAGELREDLYYRLAGVTLHLPPLRDRPMDLAALAEALVRRAAQRLGLAPKPLSREALACLGAYSWPGNVRELENELQRMLALSEGPELGSDLLSERVVGAAGASGSAPPTTVDDDVATGGTLRDRMEQLEARVIAETVRRHGGNKTRAAEELGLSRAGLRAKLTRYGIEKE